MKTSEQISELAAALAAAQGMMDNAVVNRINPHFKTKYADLAAIFDAARKPLSANGLAIVQTIGDGVLHTRLLHTSGQWIASEHPLPMSGRPQEIGSLLTYARRYSLSALIGIAADEDDDANDANAVTPRPPPRKDDRELTEDERADLMEQLNKAGADSDAISSLCSLLEVQGLTDIRWRHLPRAKQEIAAYKAWKAEQK